MARLEKWIAVREDTFEELRGFKGAGQMWDDVIQSLIECRQQQHRRLLLERTNDDYVRLDEL